ncbi:Solute carrier family 25 member 38-like protein [Zancudomyces culisetae]|uniref:Solute carrier family 25 member 38-like protein n=1 Tax=Zancudomyces culisetae TaxID=1213189 RepID=A0A1R1PMJ5_ZANCU|nr:Solute carrier family 25 member 38-like protein [Zancudomyces culisetae]|eukprot:OMH82159.1 Solute carrier family 25 member 38-like protein [Zancudomyces culisetae]
MVNITSGAISRAAAGFILMPATVVKVKFESSLYQFKGIFPAVSEIFATRGIRGFFEGAVPTAIRDAPYAALYFAIYENCKRAQRDLYSKYNMNVHISAITAISGVIGGVTASYITQPFDMIKTRMQTQPSLYTRFLQSLLKIYRDEGIFGFFHGISLRVLRKGVQASISFTLYEWVVRKQTGN